MEFRNGLRELTAFAERSQLAIGDFAHLRSLAICDLELRSLTPNPLPSAGLRLCDFGALRSRAAKRGGFPDLDLSFLFVLFGGFPDFSGIFPNCLGMVRGFSRFILSLFLGLLRAPTRSSPERVRDTIWTFPQKVGNPRVWKPPRLAPLKKFFGQKSPRPKKYNRHPPPPPQPKTPPPSNKEFYGHGGFLQKQKTQTF